MNNKIMVELNKLEIFFTWKCKLYFVQTYFKNNSVLLKLFIDDVDLK